MPSFSDPQSAEQGHVAYAILRAGTLVSAAMFASSPFSDQAARSAVNYGLLLLLHVGHLYLLRRGKVQLAVRSFCIGYYVLITATLAQFGGIRSPVGFVYPPLVLVAGLIWSSRAAIGFAIACAAAGLMFVSLEGTDVLPGAVASVDRIWTVMASVLFITAIMLHVFSNALRRARAESAALAARLEQAERLESLGRLAGGVAHDFNNQLTAMLAHTTLLRTSDDPDKRSASIDAIELATQHAAELTRQLLEFGRQRVLEPRVIDVRDAITALRNLISQSLGPLTELQTTFGPGALHVRVDRTALERVLINLILNARDAMPEGGEIRLHARRVGPPERADEAVEISVRDHGTGMDELTRAHIFDPFFTTKAHGKGTGLGLSSVLGVVTQSGGEIEVDSRQGEGSDFRVVLPAVAAAAEPDTIERAAKSPRGAQLLLVEDEAVIRRALQGVLSEAGFDVVAAGSLGEARARVASLDRPVELLVTDVMLADGNGLELLTQLRAAVPDLGAVVISGHMAGELAPSFTHDQNALLLHKPFTPHDLLRSLHELLRPLSSADSQSLGTSQP